MAAGRKVKAYAYSKERDLDNSLEVNRRVLNIDQTGGKELPLDDEVRFVEVVSIIADTDSKQATAKEIQYNATTRVFEDPTDPWLYDSDNAATTDMTTTDIYSSEPLAVGDKVEIFGNDDKSDLLQWMVRQSGGGSSLPLIRLNALSVNPFTSFPGSSKNQWSGDIVSQRTDTGNIITANVTIWAPHMDQGDLPLTGAVRGRFFRALATSNTEGINDAFDSMADDPATVYEIEPPVFLGA